MQVERFVNAFEENAYLLIDAGEAVLIDPGAEAGAIFETLKKHEATLRAVLMTHGHYDHLAGLKAVLDKRNVPIYIHEAEQAFLFDPSLNLSAFMGGEYALDDSVEVRTLRDGETVSFADHEIRVHHTPGHTAGGVCYEYRGVLFSGDTLFAGTVGRTDLPSGDGEQLRVSLKTLFERLEGKTVVYPGHGEATRLDVEQRENPFV